jgi:hypothetical protein
MSLTPPPLRSSSVPATSSASAGMGERRSPQTPQAASRFPHHLASVWPAHWQGSCGSTSHDDLPRGLGLHWSRCGAGGMHMAVSPWLLGHRSQYRRWRRGCHRRNVPGSCARALTLAQIAKGSVSCSNRCLRAPRRGSRHLARPPPWGRLALAFAHSAVTDGLGTGLACSMRDPPA